MSTKKKTDNIWEALIEARHICSTTSVKKEGRNAFAKYDYFTPSQVHNIVENACYQTGLFAGFELLKEESVIYGVLTIVHSASKEERAFKFVTDIADIKGANSAQNLGGTLTYAERYAKSSVFGITDNNLDIDNLTDSKTSEVKPKPTPTPPQNKDKSWDDMKAVFISKAKKEAENFNKTEAMTRGLATLIEKAQKTYGATGKQVMEALKEAGFNNPSKAVANNK